MTIVVSSGAMSVKKVRRFGSDLHLAQDTVIGLKPLVVEAITYDVLIQIGVTNFNQNDLSNVAVNLLVCLSVSVVKVVYLLFI